jgi:hypothetical protein
MHHKGKGSTLNEYPAALYAELLNYARDKYANKYWNALPRDVAHFWTHRHIRAHLFPALKEKSLGKGQGLKID